VDTKRLALDSLEGQLERRQGTGILAQREIIETQINHSADLHIGNARGPPQLYTLVIELNRPGDGAKFTAKPAEGVREPTNNERILPLLRLGPAFVQHGECLSIVPGTPAGLTQKSQRTQLCEAIIDGTGDDDTLLPELRRGLKLPLLVSHHAAKHQRMRQGVLIPVPPADLQGLGEFFIRFREIPTHVIHGAQADEAAGQDF
jgi:hypothetical protein